MTFSAEPDAIRQFANQMQVRASDASEAGAYMQGYLSISHADAGVYTQVAAAAAGVKDVLEANYARIRDLCLASSEELGVAASYYELTEHEQARLARLLLVGG